jgi:signal peptidase I
MDVEGPPSGGRAGYLRFIVGKNPGVTLLRILVLAVASLIIFKFILLPIRVTGDSMLPTYSNGQIRLVNRLSYIRRTPARGDVVAVEFRGQQVLLLKRIVGLPGERLDAIEGELYINGEKLEEPYARGRIPSPTGPGYARTPKPITLGPKEYMVIGDNRTISEVYIKDSEQIIGKVL